MNNDAGSASATPFDEWEWWYGAWQGRIRCGTCEALMKLDAPCPICAADYRDLKPEEVMIDGALHRVPSALCGALDWSHYSMLKMMHHDWLRPRAEGEDLPPAAHKPSSKALVVLLFWTYFESLMSWYFEAATANLPKPVAADILGRYAAIGARLDRLSRILFEKSYGEDLRALGFPTICSHLTNLQKQRNAFMHGDPEAIDDSLVEETVRRLPDFHEAWIATFNLRCAQRL